VDVQRFIVNSSLKRSRMARVNDGAHCYTCHPHVYQRVYLSCPLCDFVCLCLSICNSYNIITCSGDQLWRCIRSGSFPLHCFSLQLLFFIVVNKISIYLSIYEQHTCLYTPQPQRFTALWLIRYDTRCYFNVRSKANMSQLNLPHGNNN